MPVDNLEFGSKVRFENTETEASSRLKSDYCEECTIYRVPTKLFGLPLELTVTLTTNNKKMVKTKMETL